MVNKMVKIKSRKALEEYSSFMFQDMDQKGFKPCEVLYVLSEIQKTLSLVMLSKMQEEE